MEFVFVGNLADLFLMIWKNEELNESEPVAEIISKELVVVRTMDGEA